jgi:hypothetical protein
VTTAVGVLLGQVLVLLGGVVVNPGTGGLWPLGLAFLCVYSVLALIGAYLGMGVRRIRGRRAASKEAGS